MTAMQRSRARQALGSKKRGQPCRNRARLLLNSTKSSMKCGYFVRNAGPHIAAMVERMISGRRNVNRSSLWIHSFFWMERVSSCLFIAA